MKYFRLLKETFWGLNKTFWTLVAFEVLFLILTTILIYSSTEIITGTVSELQPFTSQEVANDPSIVLKLDINPWGIVFKTIFLSIGALTVFLFLYTFIKFKQYSVIFVHKKTFWQFFLHNLYWSIGMMLVMFFCQFVIVYLFLMGQLLGAFAVLNAILFLITFLILITLMGIKTFSNISFFSGKKKLKKIIKKFHYYFPYLIIMLLIQSIFLILFGIMTIPYFILIILGFTFSLTRTFFVKLERHV